MKRGKMQGGFFRLTTPAAGPEAKDGTTHSTEGTGTGTTHDGGGGDGGGSILCTSILCI